MFKIFIIVVASLNEFKITFEIAFKTVFEIIFKTAFKIAFKIISKIVKNQLIDFIRKRRLI